MVWKIEWTRLPAPTEDTLLVNRVLLHDARAWREFCRRYERLVFATVVRALRRYQVRLASDQIADLVADVWVALLSDDRRKLRAYDQSRGRLSSWIARIAFNSTVDQLRARTSRAAILCDPSDFESLLVEHERADSGLIARQEGALARQALAELTEEDQRFALACYCDRRSTEELAREFAISSATVYSRKFKLREKLKRTVERLG